MAAVGRVPAARVAARAAAERRGGGGEGGGGEGVGGEDCACAAATTAALTATETLERRFTARRLGKRGAASTATATAASTTATTDAVSCRCQRIGESACHRDDAESGRILSAGFDRQRNNKRERRVGASRQHGVLHWQVAPRTRREPQSKQTQCPTLFAHFSFPATSGLLQPRCTD